MNRKTLSEKERAVLLIADSGKVEIEDAILQSGLSKQEFWKCVDTLVKQKYLVGDVLLGFNRTKKPLPSASQDEKKGQ